MNSYLSKPITFIAAPTIFRNSSKTLLIKFPYSFSRNRSCKNALKPQLSFIKCKISLLLLPMLLLPVRVPTQLSLPTLSKKKMPSPLSYSRFPPSFAISFFTNVIACLVNEKILLGSESGNGKL